MREEDPSMDISMSSENEADESTEEDMPDVDKMTEEEQLAITLQMSVQDSSVESSASNDCFCRCRRCRRCRPSSQ